jgi:hypothetical protein
LEHPNRFSFILPLALLVLIVASSGTLAITSHGSAIQPITQSWVNQELVNWKPTSIPPMGFGALLATASYGNIFHNSPQVITADLNMLQSTGIGAVRIDMTFDPWLKNNKTAISEMNSVVQTVRSDKLQLVIADAGAEAYTNGGKIPWAQFQVAWVQRVKTLASLYQPDYYIVIKEPGSYVSMVSDASTNPAFQSASSWLNLTSILASTVLSVSPNTKVGISVSGDTLNTTLYVQYLVGLKSVSKINFIGFDLYTASSYSSVQTFLNQFGTGGKGVWMAEAWSSTPPNAFNPANAQLDSGWIKVAYYFAESQIHATMIIPFYTNDFSQYTSAGSISSPSFFNSREPVYSAYQSRISSNKAGKII